MKRGFTLIEMMIVIAILLIIGSLVCGALFKGCGCAPPEDAIEQTGVSADRVIVLEERLTLLENRVKELESKK